MLNVLRFIRHVSQPADHQICSQLESQRKRAVVYHASSSSDTIHSSVQKDADVNENSVYVISRTSSQEISQSFRRRRFVLNIIFYAFFLYFQLYYYIVVCTVYLRKTPKCLQLYVTDLAQYQSRSAYNVQTLACL